MRKVCTVCRGGYRTWAVHVGTDRHRRALRGPADSGRRLGSKSSRSYRVPPAWKGTDVERVRKHRRRHPLDGPRRDVKVRAYARERYQRWIEHVSASGIIRRIRVRANL